MKREIPGFNNPEWVIPIKDNGKVVWGISATPKQSAIVWDKNTLFVHKIMISSEHQGKGLWPKAIFDLFKSKPEVERIFANATAGSRDFWEKVGAKFIRPNDKEFSGFYLDKSDFMKFYESK